MVSLKCVFFFFCNRYKKTTFKSNDNIRHREKISSDFSFIGKRRMFGFYIKWIEKIYRAYITILGNKPRSFITPCMHSFQDNFKRKFLYTLIVCTRYFFVY